MTGFNNSHKNCGPKNDDDESSRKAFNERFRWSKAVWSVEIGKGNSEDWEGEAYISKSTKEIFWKL